MCLGLPWRGDIFDISVYLRFEIFQHEAAFTPGLFQIKDFVQRARNWADFTKGVRRQRHSSGEKWVE